MASQEAVCRHESTVRVAEIVRDRFDAGVEVIGEGGDDEMVRREADVGLFMIEIQRTGCECSSF